MKEQYFETYQQADDFISTLFKQYGRWSFDGMTVRADGYRVYFWADRKYHRTTLLAGKV